MRNLFSELKRRNVFRVGVAYGVVGWLLAQAAELVLPTFGAPEWVLKSLIFVLLLGLPVALFLAWAFELTPEGMKRTGDVDLGESITPVTGRTLDRVIILVLVVALGWFAWDRFAPPPGGDTASSETAGAEKSVAVLPFVNLSSDPEQEYFSDGISEELLNVLAKMPGLRVAARTSSFQFKGENRDISEIGRKLGVNHVLEGSVRKAGKRLRITAQLIDVANGFHLWSETYDRELDDIFAIQDEISAAIASALKVHLGGAGETAVAQDAVVTATPKVARTTTPEAYEDFLLARHLISRRTQQSLAQAIERFEAVVAADPAYAPAWAGLAEATALSLDSPNSSGNLPLDVVIARATPALERALELDPDLADAYAARGLLRLFLDRDEEAVADFDRAIALNPNMARAHYWRSNVLSETLGRIREGMAGLETALRLDPLSVVPVTAMASRLGQRGRFDQARAYIDRAAALEPARARGSLSEWYWQQGDRAGAIIEANRALTMGAPLARYRLYIARMLVDLGMAPVAEPWLGDQRYQAMTAEGRHQDAVEHLQTLFLRRPDDTNIVSALGGALLNSGDAAGAVVQFRRLFEISPDYIRSRFNWQVFSTLAYARALVRTGDEAGATARIAAARAEVDHRRSEGLDNAFLDYLDALVMANNGRTGEALASMNRALDRGFLMLWIDVLPVPAEFAADPGFQALRDRNSAEQARQRAEIARRLCGPESEVADNEYKAAICAALAGG